LSGRYVRVVDHLAVRNVAQGAPLGDGSTFNILLLPMRCTFFFQIYFWNRTLHVSDRVSLHYQESSIVYTAKGICPYRLL